MRAARRFLLVIALLYRTIPAHAQTVSPIIVEYVEQGEGKIELTNSSLAPLVVVLEPKSFTISPDGTAIYRPLDPAIHVELSAMSMRLLPKQSYTVFYKAKADHLPAWFTVYATFSSPRSSPGINLRIMLPHTVYLCQKAPLPKEAVVLSNVEYDQQKGLISFDVSNQGRFYGRVRSGVISGRRDSTDVGGFALLPGGSRHIEVRWTAKAPPQQVKLRFDSFDVRQQITSVPAETLALTAAEH